MAAKKKVPGPAQIGDWVKITERGYGKTGCSGEVIAINKGKDTLDFRTEIIVDFHWSSTVETGRFPPKALTVVTRAKRCRGCQINLVTRATKIFAGQLLTAENILLSFELLFCAKCNAKMVRKMKSKTRAAERLLLKNLKGGNK